MSVRVLIVDDHPVVGDALAARLRLEPDVSQVSMVAIPEQVLPTIERVRPDVVVWDVHQGRHDGILLLRQARVRYPESEAVVITAEDEPRAAVALVRAGAVSLVSKNAPAAELVDAVMGASRHESHIDNHLLYEMLPLLRRQATAELDDRRISRLSPRELEVLEHMVAGEDRATIARELYISVNTVRTHAKNILAKLEVHSTLEAVRVALEAGMRPPGPDPSPDPTPAFSTVPSGP